MVLVDDEICDETEAEVPEFESEDAGNLDFRDALPEFSDGEDAHVYEESLEHARPPSAEQVENEVVGECQTGGQSALDEMELDDEELESLIGSDEGDKGEKRYIQFDPLLDFNKPIEFSRGMVFSSNEIVREALRQYAVENGGDYFYLHNDKSKISVYCVHRCDCPLEHGRKKCACTVFKCGFKAYARKIATDGTFQLKGFVGKHECGWQEKNKKLRGKWLAEKYLENFRDDPSWKLSAFIQDVRRKYGVHLGYSLAWKARNKAMLMIRGDAKKQYAKIWDYAATTQTYNEGSTVFVKVDLQRPEKPIFQRIYVSFAASIKGFKEGCRPIVGVDGCHLRGAFSGQVLVAVGKDGNNQIFPVAFAVVEAERRETWGWFLEILMRDIGEVNPTFMSDRQKGLIEEMNLIVPPHKLRVCVRHLYNNFKQQWSGSALKNLVWAAARAYTKKYFQTHMDEIKKVDARAFDYLMSQNPSTWSRHLFQKDTKSDMLLNNVCESFNAFILPCRDRPVISLCEWIRRELMNRFVTKRASMAGYGGAFTPNATKLIEAAKMEASKNCRCIWGGGNTYEVDHHQRTFVVDLEKRTCGCFKWELTGIPCPHAICSIMKTRGNIEEYVDRCYSTDTYKTAYSGVINAQPDEADYVESGNVPPEPPIFVTQPGRPKKHARRRQVGEEPPPSKRPRIRVSGFKKKCSICRQLGHTKNKCTLRRDPGIRLGQVKNTYRRRKNQEHVGTSSEVPNGSRLRQVTYTYRRRKNQEHVGTSNEVPNGSRD